MSDHRRVDAFTITIGLLLALCLSALAIWAFYAREVRKAEIEDLQRALQVARTSTPPDVESERCFDLMLNERRKRVRFYPTKEIQDACQGIIIRSILRVLAP